MKLILQEEQSKITVIANALLDAYFEWQKKIGKEPKEIKVDFDRLVEKFKEAGINATYRQE